MYIIINKMGTISSTYVDHQIRKYNIVPGDNKRHRSKRKNTS